MKGLELTVILGIIVVVAIILLVFILVILPAFGMGERNRGELDFRNDCLFWSLNGYKGMEYKDSEGIPHPMNGICAKNIGASLMSSSEYGADWERCRNLCRATV